VRIVRDPLGVVIGFQDPDAGNRFITRYEALERSSFSVERGAMIDSFGNTFQAGALATPQAGRVVTYTHVSASYVPISGNPANITPGPNQEIIERQIIITPGQKLETLEISHGRGERYVEGKHGGAWRREAGKKLGEKEGKRIPTRDLKRAIAHVEYLLKTVA
jgi:hypothetical protein